MQRLFLETLGPKKGEAMIAWTLLSFLGVALSLGGLVYQRHYPGKHAELISRLLLVTGWLLMAGFQTFKMFAAPQTLSWPVFFVSILALTMNSGALALVLAKYWRRHRSRKKRAHRKKVAQAEKFYHEATAPQPPLEHKAPKDQEPPEPEIELRRIPQP